MRHLPPRIAQALASLHLDVKLTEIGSNAFIALARIITFVDKDNPAKPIQVNRKTLAECIGVSIETTYRALRELDTGGWISRVKTSNRMGGSDSPMHLTEKTLNRLGLDKPLTNYLNKPSINAIDNIYNINNQVQKTTVMAMIPDAVSATSAMAPESVRTESTQSDKHLAATDLSPVNWIP
jgi:Crp-like helix-turn-helix domain